MNEYIVKKKITIDAKPSVVWDALTNPEKTKKYFFHCRVLSDWKPGSSIIFRGRIFLIKKIEMNGTIVQVVPEKLLQYKLKNSGGNGATESTVTDKLTFENGKTTLSISDDVGQGEGAEKRYKMSMKGWDRVLSGLKKLVEEENP